MHVSERDSMNTSWEMHEPSSSTVEGTSRNAVVRGGRGDDKNLYTFNILNT
jgi:hypothetical protein